MGKHSKHSSTARSIAALGVVAAVPAALALGPAPEAHAAGADWDPIIECESGGNPTAQNSSSTASGLFQFIDGTWAAYGGTEYASKAKHATVAQQYEIANRAFAAEGYTPWAASNGCHGLIGTEGSFSGSSSAPETASTKKAKPAPAPVEASLDLDAETSVTTPSVETYQALPVVVPAGASFTAGGSGSYTVQLGDTLSSLALEHGTTVGALVDLNKDIIEMPDWIFAGEQIRLK